MTAGKQVAHRHHACVTTPVDLHQLLAAGRLPLVVLQVFQVRARASGKVFAMKVMRKERILQKDHGDYVKAERDLLTAVLHPYIVTLRYSFQTASKLYLVLDFINGGHLFFNLYRQVRVGAGWGWLLGAAGSWQQQLMVECAL